MADKKRKKREYLNDFRMNEKGKYEYQGKLIGWPKQGKSRKRMLAEIWICIGIAAAGILLDGCMADTGLEKRSFMVLPYILQVVLVVSMVWSGGSLLAAGEKIREYVFEKTAARIPSQAAGLMILSGICIFADLVSLCLPDFTWSRAMALFWLVPQAAAFISGRHLRKLFAEAEGKWEDYKP